MKTTTEKNQMNHPRVASRAEWLAARLELLKEEKELTRRSDEVAGKELFFTNGSSLMVVDVTAGSTFDFALPRKLCDVPQSTQVWDIAPDGKQFLVRVIQAQQITLPRLEGATEWFEDVKGKIAGNKNY